MEFLVIVLFVVAIVAVNFVISRAQRRKKQTDGESPAGGESRSASKGAAKAAPGTPRTSVEAAREANARLDETQHQQVYAAIAQGHPIKAVKLYAQFTGVGVRAAGAAVENLAVHPQPHHPQQPQKPQRPAPDAPAGAAAAEPVAAAEPGEAGEPGSPKIGDTGSPVTGRTAADQHLGPDTLHAPDLEADRKSDREDINPKDAAPEGPLASADKPRQGPAAKPSATPEEDEISKWVKNLRPEDF